MHRRARICEPGPVTFTLAFAVDLVAAWLVVALVAGAGFRPDRGRLLLLAALVAVAVRAGADVALAGHGLIFARPLLVALPLSAIPVLALVAWSLGRRPPPALVWAGAGVCAVGAIDPVLLAGPATTGALAVLAVTGAWLLGGGVSPAALRRRVAAVSALALAGIAWQAGQGWWGSRLPDRYDLAALAGTDSGGGPQPVPHGTPPDAVPPVTASPDAASSGSGEHHGADHLDAGRQDAAHLVAGRPVDVRTLTGPSGPPDVRIALAAAPLTVRRGGGEQPGLAFNGTVPGPPVRARVGDLVQVSACNRGVADGVSVHWHGYDVPNAEDGVAGVTQDAIPDGGCRDYRFRAEQAGTYWYHAHQASSTQVDRGLYGALVVDPRGTGTPPPDAGSAPSPTDLVVLDHGWRPPGGYLAGAAWRSDDRVEQAVVAPGTPVRLRLVNTDRLAHRYRVAGTPFQVVAVDGTDVAGATALDARSGLVLAAGGRYDLRFTMPAGGVRIDGFGEEVSLLLTGTRDGRAPAVPAAEPTGDLDLLHYGDPDPPVTAGGTAGEAATGSADVAETAPPRANSAAAATATGTAIGTAAAATAGADAGVAGSEQALRGRPDRDFSLVIDQRIAFSGGRVGYRWAVGGHTYPRMPMLMVRRGDVVRVRLVNRTTADHPMHLHGHHVLVLSRNGVRSTGSPWWSDTLNVRPGEDFVVAFRADNPGIWMDHCHDLQHAADGFVLHLAYDGVRTPFRIGTGTPNRPE